MPSFLSSKILEVQGSRLKRWSLLSSILWGRGLYPGSPKEMPPTRSKPASAPRRLWEKEPSPGPQLQPECVAWEQRPTAVQATLLTWVRRL